MSYFLVDRVGCKTDGGRTRSFMKVHTFNDHHIRQHMSERDAKELARQLIPDVRFKSCRHCVRMGRVKSFQTHKAMLSHYVTEHFSDEQHDALYKLIDEAFPSNNDSDSDEDGDAVSVISAKSSTSIASRYSTDSGGSNNSSMTAGSGRSNTSGVTARMESLAVGNSRGSKVAPAPAPAPSLPPGALTCEEFLSQTGCTVLDYYVYLGQLRAHESRASIVKSQMQSKPAEAVGSEDESL